MCIHIHVLYTKYTYMYVCMFFCLGGGKENKKRKKAVNIEEMKQRRKTAKKDAGL